MKLDMTLSPHIMHSKNVAHSLWISLFRHFGSMVLISLVLKILELDPVCFVKYQRKKASKDFTNSPITQKYQVNEER